jgi:SAM-dependent methyltransferase
MQGASPFSPRVQVSYGQLPSQPDAQRHARIRFERCPLCEAPGIAVLRTADCSAHPLYHPVIPAVMTWMRCEACGHVFTDGYFAPETEAVLFSRVNKNQQPGWDMDEQRTVSSFIVDRVAQLVGEGAWLDVGFGNAALLFTAQEWGFTPVGVDLRQSSVDALAGFGIEAHCVDITAWDQPGRFSVVSLADVLEHMPFPKRALGAIKRLLKPDGMLFLSMPSYDCALWRKLDSENACPYWSELEHFHNFSRARLYALLEETGFKPLRFNVSLRYRVGMEIVARSVG